MEILNLEPGNGNYSCSTGVVQQTLHRWEILELFHRLTAISRPPPIICPLSFGKLPPSPPSPSPALVDHCGDVHHRPWAPESEICWRLFIRPAPTPRRHLDELLTLSLLPPSSSTPSPPSSPLAINDESPHHGCRKTLLRCCSLERGKAHHPDWRGL